MKTLVLHIVPMMLSGLLLAQCSKTEEDETDPLAEEAGPTMGPSSQMPKANTSSQPRSSTDSAQGAQSGEQFENPENGTNGGADGNTSSPDQDSESQPSSELSETDPEGGQHEVTPTPNQETESGDEGTGTSPGSEQPAPPPPPAPKPWLNGFSYRTKIVLNNAGVLQATGPTPLLITLPANFRYAATATDQSGRDIRFTAADGKTLLPYVFETWSFGETSRMWVRVPGIPVAGTPAEIYLYYGNPQAVDGQSETVVWGQESALVLQANDFSRLPNVRDSVSGTFGTATDRISGVTGILNQGLRLDGTAYNATSYPVVAGIATGRGSNTNQATIGLWIKPETGSANGFRRIAHSNAAFFGLSSAEVLNPGFLSGTGSMIADLRGNLRTDRTSDGGSAGPWQFVVVTWDLSDIDTLHDQGQHTMAVSSYLNGTLDATWVAQLASSPPATASNWFVGNRPEGTRPYKGGIDHFFIHERQTSEDELLLHYASVRGSEARIGVAQSSNLTTYSVTVNGTVFSYVSDSSATQLEILGGLASQINGGTEPVTAGSTGTFLWINPDDPRVPMTVDMSQRLTRVVRPSFESDVEVAIGSLANSTSYTVTINEVPFTYTSDADASLQEVRTGLIELINASSLPVLASEVGDRLKLALRVPSALDLSTTANLSVAVDGSDRVLSIENVQSSSSYRVTVGGSNLSFTSPPSSTLVSLRNSIVQMINNASGTVAVRASVDSQRIRVSIAPPREFTVATSTNLSVSTKIRPFNQFEVEETP